MSKTKNTLPASYAALFAAYLTLIICSGCATSAQRTHEASVYVTQTYQLPQFSGINISGNSYVFLVDGNPSAFVDVEQHNLKNINLKVSNGILYIDNTAAHPMMVKLHANNIRTITVRGKASIFSHNIFTKHGEITALNNANISFDGIFDVRKITQQGRGKVAMKWIKSNELRIDANNDGPIYLAGVATHLTAKLTDNAFLDARYLRARHAEIFATNSARAEVMPVKSLDSFADKQSTIYYHKLPHKLNKVTRDSGNVLLCDEIR